MKIKYILVFSFISICCKHSFAQESKGAVGLRFGYGWGFTGKYFLDRNGNALEFTLKQGVHGVLYSTNFLNIGTTYQKHFKIDRRGKWLVYVGGGGALGAGKAKKKETIVSVGAVPIAGLDFWTQNLVIPFNLSFDYSPSMYYDRNTTTKKNGFIVNYLNFNIAVRIGIGRL